MIARAGMGEPMSLLAFDLDHFKAINDGYGHALGDAALKLVASTLQAALRRDKSVNRDRFTVTALIWIDGSGRVSRDERSHVAPGPRPRIPRAPR